MGDFVDWWHRIVPIREGTGFTLLCAFTLHETNEFVSAGYYGDPQRRRLAGEARAWAIAHAVRTTGQPADSPEVTALVAEHPGFTADTHITTAEIAHPGQLKP
jgi:hypothetical protein